MGDKVICGLFPQATHQIVRIVEARPHMIKGAPALSGYLGTDTPWDRREYIVVV